MGYIKYYASRQSLQIAGSMDFSLGSEIDFLQHGRCSDIGHSFSIFFDISNEHKRVRKVSDQWYKFCKR